MGENKKTIIFLSNEESTLAAGRIVCGVKDRITKHRTRQARERFIFGIISLPASILLSIPVLRLLFTEVADSGFFEYIKLIFSDIGGVVPYWRESLTILAESFPAFGVFAFLSVLCLFLLSLQSLAITMGKNNSRMHFKYSK